MASRVDLHISPLRSDVDSIIISTKVADRETFLVREDLIEAFNRGLKEDSWLSNPWGRTKLHVRLGWIAHRYVQNFSGLIYYYQSVIPLGEPFDQAYMRANARYAELLVVEAAPQSQ